MRLFAFAAQMFIEDASHPKLDVEATSTFRSFFAILTLKIGYISQSVLSKTLGTITSCQTT